MPNWVYNNLTIAPDAEAGGTAKDVADLVEQVGKSFITKYRDWKTDELQEHLHEDHGFSFWNIVHPDDEELDKYNESLSASGVSPFWYGWNCDNWGTKWDASNVDMTDHGPDHKQYTFDTPWSPPIPVLTKLSEQHPNLHIELEWEEEQGFGGTFVFRNGEATETNYYDIPSSHADYVSRGRECSCEVWSDEPPFEDCPGHVAPPTDDMLIPQDELEVEAVK